GGRTQAFDVDTVQLIAGIDGTLSDAAGPLGNWGYDVSFNFARNNTTVTTGGSLNTQLVAQAFGPSANGQCLTTAGDVIPGCFAANPFGLVNGQTLTPAQVASLGGFTGINHGGNQMAMVELNLNGELPVTLMADRPLGLAMGYAYRSEYGFFTFNPIAVTNNDSDFSGTNAAGRFHVNEVYGELSVPVISGMSYVEALELQAAVRYSNYNTFGGTTTYKFGARYTPVRDVTFRGTYSTGFRAPGITSLFGGSTPNAEAATDPCANGVNPNSPLGQQCAQNLKRGGGGAVALNNGDPSTQINSTSGANPALQPEKADIYTAGIVLEPRSLLRNFTFTADYFHVKVNQNITSITTPVILAGCYSGTATNNQAFCDLIQRNTDGSIFDVTDVLQNVGTETIQGLDISARYGIPTSVGRFNISADSTLLFQHDQVLADGTVIKGLNTYDLFVNPTAKFNLGVGYNVGGFLAAVRGRFVTGFHECADPDGVSSGSGLCYKNNLQADGTPFPVHNIPFYDVYDVHLSYALRLGTGTTTISAGIRNVLNKDPPRVYNTVAQTNSDPSTYDYLGRNYYAQLAHRF
ncbi:MAG: TonB-dependent receptor, partial [Anaeromyxobacteraceae bacterium]